jgi:hypothetical protein
VDGSEELDGEVLTTFHDYLYTSLRFFFADDGVETMVYWLPDFLHLPAFFPLASSVVACFSADDIVCHGCCI